MASTKEKVLSACEVVAAQEATKSEATTMTEAEETTRWNDGLTQNWSKETFLRDDKKNEKQKKEKEKNKKKNKKGKKEGRLRKRMWERMRVQYNELIHCTCVRVNFHPFRWKKKIYPFKYRERVSNTTQCLQFALLILPSAWEGDKPLSQMQCRVAISWRLKCYLPITHFYTVVGNYTAIAHVIV